MKDKSAKEHGSGPASNRGSPDATGVPAVDQARRRFAKVGAATPILMTLASRPVLGARCVSDQMSGDQSAPDDNSCVFGRSYNDWKSGAGWPSPFVPMVLEFSPDSSFRNKNCRELGGRATTFEEAPECWKVDSSATTLADTPLGYLFPGYGEYTLTELLSQQTYTGEALPYQLACYVAAMLNVYGVTGYVLGNSTRGMSTLVKMIENSMPIPPGYSNLASYLEDTW